MTKKITFNKLLMVGQFDYSRCFYMVDLNKGYQHKTQNNLDHNQAFEECSKNIEETSASNKNLGETSLNDNVVNDENTATKEDGEILEEDETIEEHLGDQNNSNSADCQIVYDCPRSGSADHRPSHYDRDFRGPRDYRRGSRDERRPRSAGSWRDRECKKNAQWPTRSLDDDGPSIRRDFDRSFRRSHDDGDRRQESPVVRSTRNDHGYRDRDVRDPRDVRGPRDYYEPRHCHGTKNHRCSRGLNDQGCPQDFRGHRDYIYNKHIYYHEIRGDRGSARDLDERDPQYFQEPRDYRGTRDDRGSRDRDERDPQDLRGPRDYREPRHDRGSWDMDDRRLERKDDRGNLEWVRGNQHGDTWQSGSPAGRLADGSTSRRLTYHYSKSGTIVGISTSTDQAFFLYGGDRGVDDWRATPRTTMPKAAKKDRDRKYDRDHRDDDQDPLPPPPPPPPKHDQDGEITDVGDNSWTATVSKLLGVELKR